ncbi:TIGR02710 family CRISPR-associated protein, partial [Candidatus Pacearchaeota archaeon]
MTVGTAIGEDADKKIESLAHGLLVCIEHYKPDHIVFFGSEDSCKTIKEIERQHKSQYNKELSSYEFIQFTSIDDFDSCFQLIQNEIYKYSNSEIIIDYTSGTKTMTMSAAIAAVLFHKKLTLISGRRKDGVVLSGTERIVEQSLYSLYDKLLLRRMKESFNNYRYNAARNYLDEIVLLNGDKTKEYYYNLIDSY